MTKSDSISNRSKGKYFWLGLLQLWMCCWRGGEEAGVVAFENFEILWVWLIQSHVRALAWRRLGAE